jgi:hypothetical protein
VLVLLVVAVHDHDGGAGVVEAGEALQHLCLIPHLHNIVPFKALRVATPDVKRGSPDLQEFATARLQICSRDAVMPCV